MAINPGPNAALPQIVRWIRLGAAAVMAAIGLSLLELPALGAWLAVGGMALMAWNLHRLGRTGPV